jgi:uncharacterized protein (TIRG00374 family)
MKRLLRHVSQVGPALAALGLAFFVLRGADLERALGQVRSQGWRLSFGLLGGRPRFRPLLRLRLAIEAVMLGLPSGAVVSESLQPVLLKRRCGLPFETAVVAGVGRKFLVVVSHGIVLALATLLAWPLLDRVSQAAIGRRGLPWALLAVSAFMIGTFGVAVALGARSRMAGRVHLVLERVFGRWLGVWLERNALRFQRADEHLVAFFWRDPRALALPMLLYCSGWLVRALETFVYLKLLGVDIGFTTAIVVESSIILVRSMAVPIPAGLGVQDVAYVLTFRALGVPDATTVGTSFVVLKRAKDLFWILTGFLLLGIRGRGARGGELELPLPDHAA